MGSICSGTGIYNLSGNADYNKSNGWMVVGRDAGSVGVLNVSNTAQVNIPNGPLLINQNGGIGTVNQSGGSISASWVDVGNGGTDQVATYNMSGGTLTSINEINVGRNGVPGHFTNSGGTVLASTANNNDFNVGRGATGTLDMSGGTINTVRAFLVGPGEGGRPSVGVVNQSGGVITTGQWFSVGADTSANGSSGVYN